MPAGFSPVLFLFDGRPAIGEGNGPRNLRVAIDRLDSYLSRPKYCLPPPDGGARVCRRGQASVSVRLRMEAMLLGPLRLLFLLLMSGVGASTRWILFLHKMSGETFCSISCVRLGRILSLPCEGISSLASDGRTVFFPGVVGGAYDGGVKLLFPLVFNSDGGGDDIGSAEDSRRRLCSS